MAECVEDQVNVVTKQNGAVAIEIASNDRPQKLKPLPAALLNRMMHTTNTNKFEFMKNPDAKTGHTTHKHYGKWCAPKAPEAIKEQFPVSGVMRVHLRLTLCVLLPIILGEWWRFSPSSVVFESQSLSRTSHKAPHVSHISKLPPGPGITNYTVEYNAASTV